MNRYSTGVSILIFFAAMVSPVACQAPAITTGEQKVEAYELTFPAMGTQLAFQCYSDNEVQVNTGFTAAQQEVERLVEILSDYSTESETVLLSALEKTGQWQPVSPELFEVLQVCDRWNKLSDGAFDASVGQLSILWRKARKQKTLPTPEQITAARRMCGWSHVKLDADKRQVRIDLSGLRLDFGAMGKGYVIDKAYDTLAKHNLACASVRAGGDLRLGTAPPGKNGWPVEIAKLSDTEAATQMFLAKCAISSSGDLYQYIEIDGVRRSHVLDPKTGIGVPGPRQVTVIAATSTEADAADTAMCIMDDATALQVAQKLGNLEVRLATKPASANAPLIINSTAGFVDFRAQGPSPLKTK